MQMISSFLRAAGSVALLLVGGLLFLYSVAVAFGWDAGPFSLLGTIIAATALGLMFGGYKLSRELDGGPIAAGCLMIALGLGSSFLVFGLLALFLLRDGSTPTAYFIVVGFFCCLALVKFPTSTK
jgi:hypothetical protein